ncbi:MAG: adenylosuccinate synthase [Vulcanimicrobiota bacterium]
MKHTAIIGAQWGDEGKGKISNYLSEKFDIIARFAGGNNAGHTVVIKDKKFKFHHIPSGIFHCNKINLMGSGMVIDLGILMEEIEGLQKMGFDCENLRISKNAHLIMPYHRMVDGFQEGKRKEDMIGTTKRGIGPAYTDKVARIGIRIGDLLYPDLFRKKLQRQLHEWNHILCKTDNNINEEEIFNEFVEYGERLSPLLIDGSLYLFEEINRDKKILFEGAQAVLLDIDWGTYPFVTSSNCIAGGISTGLGVDPRKVENIIGIAKAYTTRIGTGPFATELKDETGKHMLDAGNEYGTTTGRPRRCGWLDLVILKYASRISAMDQFALMKLDVLSGLEKLKLCVGYQLEGKIIADFPVLETDQENCTPIYEVMDGWKEDITEITAFHQLPENARKYIKLIEDFTRTPIGMISVGPEQNQTIIREIERILI